MEPAPSPVKFSTAGERNPSSSELSRIWKRGITHALSWGSSTLEKEGPREAGLTAVTPLPLPPQSWALGWARPSSAAGTGRARPGPEKRPAPERPRNGPAPAGGSPRSPRLPPLLLPAGGKQAPPSAINRAESPARSAFIFVRQAPPGPAGCRGPGPAAGGRAGKARGGRRPPAGRPRAPELQLPARPAAGRCAWRHGAPCVWRDVTPLRAGPCVPGPQRRAGAGAAAMLEEAGEVLESVLKASCLPLSFLLFVPAVLLLLGPPPAAEAAHEFTVYRMQQYELGGQPYGEAGPAPPPRGEGRRRGGGGGRRRPGGVPARLSLAARPRSVPAGSGPGAEPRAAAAGRAAAAISCGRGLGRELRFLPSPAAPCPGRFRCASSVPAAPRGCSAACWGGLLRFFPRVGLGLRFFWLYVACRLCEAFPRVRAVTCSGNLGSAVTLSPHPLVLASSEPSILSESSADVCSVSGHAFCL